MQDFEDDFVDEDQNEYNSSEELMPRVFNIDQIEEELSEQEIEALKYLHDVREQLKNAPKYTQCSTDHIQLKKTDLKYIPESQIEKIIEKSQNKILINPQLLLWSNDTVEQFKNISKNIDLSRQWFQQLGKEKFEQTLVQFDTQDHQKLILLIKKKQLFIKNFTEKEEQKILIPTMYLMVLVDYQCALKLLRWIVEALQNEPKLNYSKCFWVYCILSQIQEPIDGETVSDINVILKQCLKQRDTLNNDEKSLAQLMILVSIIVIVFKQTFMK